MKHHCCILKLKECRFLCPRQEFVGIDVLGEGNTPAKSKTAAFASLGAPATCSDLRMLIGMFGFYSMWIVWYETRIGRWRRHLAEASPNPASAEENSRATLKEVSNATQIPT